MRNQKGLAPIVIILLVAVAIGGYLVYSGKLNLNKTSPVDSQNTIQTTEPSPVKENTRFNNGSIRICGDIPDAAFPSYGHYDMRTGPKWSSDCKHIAWAMWESGTSYLGDDSEILKELENNPRKLSEKEGVFLYDAITKKVTKIYTPQELNESPQFLGWVDNDNFLFKASQTEFNYNLTTKKYSSEDQIDAASHKYTNSKYGFTLVYPDGWKLSTDNYLNDINDYIIFSTYEGTRNGSRLELYKDFIGGFCEGSKEIKDSVVEFNNGIKGRKIECSSTISINFQKDGNNLWLIAQNVTDKNRDLFNQAIATFKLTN